MWATTHGRPIPYGVNVFLGASLRADPLVDALLRAREDLEKTARNRDVPFPGPVRVRPSGKSSRLAALGFSSIVVHKAALTGKEWARTAGLLREAFGGPTFEDLDVAVWAVR